ncbi:polysaccharide pyruvyl transferase family protein [Ruania alkalisoli]|uniref:Polysaccharide pyruvyl transferase family protein n=1 Tax=Ruania alkalisoli TaxID=2779775 RepID=A0A7M1SVE4_9MICO|nr:polysaccharide pyruvyl transferase family protein [Ruania alkalisoli]QOR71550.1 polysaccharide pyruvyl transferase family protein [Ruania alkalisoli]
MPAKVLLRSGWQTVNIGDVAHSPRTLRAFQHAAPDAELVFWPRVLGEREREMFRRHFPDVQVVDGALDEAGRPDTAELAHAWDTADVLVHGSGPGPVCRADLRAWQRESERPSGFFGITVDPWEAPEPATLDEQAVMIDTLPESYLGAERDVFDHSAFMYCRDSLSARFLRRQNVASPVLGFGPDATLVHDRHDEDAASDVSAAYGLREGDFLCVLPRLRFTPYHRIPEKGVAARPENWRRDAVNALHTEADMLPLRAAITAWVRDGGGQVLICPEMIHEVEVGERYLAHGYPPDVQRHVHHLDRYWELTEAAAVYARAAGVLSAECHSPLLAAVCGTPALYLRQPTDTIKGQMYPDLGMPMVELERDGTPAVLSWLRELCERPDDLRADTVRAQQRARSLIEEMARSVAATV